MKKMLVSINLVLLPFTLIACSTKKQTSGTIESKNQSKKVDQELVNQVVGTWYGEQPENYGEYQILKEGNSLFFKEKEFQIIKTDQSIIYTKENQKQDKEWYCDFNLNEKQLVISQYFPVPEGVAGGVLAPIIFSKVYSNKVEIAPSEDDGLKAYEAELEKVYSLYKKAKEPFKLEITHYTIEGELIVEILEFDGQEFIYTTDTTGDSFGKQETIKQIYEKMDYQEFEDEQMIGNVRKEYRLSDPKQISKEKEIIFDVSEVK